MRDIAHRPLRKASATGLSALAVLVTLTAASSSAELAVQKAWVPPVDAVGGDVVLSMTVRNDGDADALLRASCPFANFAEKHTVDLGEGAPAKRTIPNIPVPAHATVMMVESGYHVMLLQTREKLTEGATYTCSVTFRRAGPLEVGVRVARAPPAS